MRSVFVKLWNCQIFLTLLLALPFGINAAGIDTNVAAELFVSKGVHSFLVKNCASCHGDSEYGQILGAPQHSAKDATAAFPIFLRKLNNFEVPSESLFLKYANTQHYCTKYKAKCENSDKMLAELNALIAEYTSEVLAKSTSSNNSEPVQVNVKDFARVHPTRKKFEVNSKPTTFLKSSTNKNGYIEVNFIIPYTDKRTIPFDNQLKLEFKPLSDGYYKLERAFVISEPGFFKVKGMYFAINGIPVSEKTGFERIDRGLQFLNSPLAPRFATTSVLLSNAKPIFQLKDGDTLQVAFEQFEALDQFPTRVNPNVFDSDRNLYYVHWLNSWEPGRRGMLNALLWLINIYEHNLNPNSLWNSNYLNGLIQDEVRAKEKVYSQQLAFEIESRIDFSDPTRSILYTYAKMEVAKNDPNFSLRFDKGEDPDEFLAAVLAKIQLLVDSAQK